MLAVTSVAAPDTRTTRKKLVKSEQEVTVVADSTTVSPDSITIADYDKPLRSNYETFFVTNRHSRTIVRITIDIDYIDMNGSQLHSRSVTVECEIPPEPRDSFTQGHGTARKHSITTPRAASPARLMHAPTKWSSRPCRCCLSNEILNVTCFQFSWICITFAGITI